MLQRTLAAFFLWISLFVAFSPPSLAQEQDAAQSESINLVQWLKQLEQTYKLSFSYNHTLLKEIRIFYLPTCGSLEACLDFIQSQTAIRFERLDETQFLIIPIRKSVRFRVVETGTGLPVYSMFVQINDQEAHYLFPDEEDTFLIEDLFPTDSLRFQSKFHFPVRLVAQDLFQLKTPYELPTRTVHLKEVVVQDYLTNGVNLKLQDHSIHIDMRKLGLLPGESDNDVLLLLKNLPGIRTPDGKPGSLTIRGSTLDQQLILFDDIPIYHPGHFLGTISPYNPQVVDRIEVYRSTLPAKYGGRVGGMISLRTENPLQDSSNINVMSSSIYAGLKVNVPLIQDKLGILLAARSSLPFNQLAPKLAAYAQLNYQGSRIDSSALSRHEIVDPFVIRFRDLLGKIVFQPHPNHQVSMTYLGIFNRHTYTLRDTIRGPQEAQQADLDNWGITTKWAGRFSSNIRTQLSLTRSNLSLFNKINVLRSGPQPPPSPKGNRSRLIDTRLMSEIEIQTGPQLTLLTGYQLFSQSLNNFLFEGNVNMPPLRDDQAMIHSVFFSGQPQIGSRVSGDIGIRLNHYSPLSRLFIDPRLSASFIVNRSLILKASAGQAHQNMQQRLTDDFDDFRLSNQYWFMPRRPNGVMEGRQIMIGSMLEQAGWLIDLELHRKQITGLEQESSPGPQQPGIMRSKGADVFVKKKWGVFESWISYSLSHVEIEFEEVQEAIYNQPHILNLSGILNQGPWTVALSWGYLSGMPVYIPKIDPNHPNSNGQSELIVPFTDRFPAQHQLDISATYTYQSKRRGWKAVIGASLINAYNQLNYINIIQNNPQVSNPYRYALGATPDMHISISF